MLEKSFANKLKSLRKYKSITQEKLAEMVDLDVRHIARLEAGDGLPTVTTLLKFCAAFGVTPNDLLEFDKSVNDDTLKSEIKDILNLANTEQLELIKKLILAVL
uniref:helix-turn-helix transcriptional regulator n=1 Tax=Candidatus Scatousia sp. TaxID=3085663 RepID=UPI0040293A24